MSNTPSTAEHQVRRPGIKSSEGIMTAITPVVVMAITYVVKRYELDVEPVELATMLLTIGGAVVAYIHSRGAVKVSRNMASGAAAAIPNVAAGGDVHLETGTKPEFAETDESEFENFNIEEVSHDNQS